MPEAFVLTAAFLELTLCSLVFLAEYNLNQNFAVFLYGNQIPGQIWINKVSIN